jgi:hypothetical protein
MRRWRALLIVYRELNVRLPRGRWRKRPVHHIATDQEIDNAVGSFRGFPRLAAKLTSNVVQVEGAVVQADRPLSSLTRDGELSFWPSPDDTRLELEQFAPRGSYESIFVFWPGTDFEKGTSVPCRGWGLGMGGSDWTNGATYAVVSSAPSSAWLGEALGEVWLHEWLHGVCHHFSAQGCEMPSRDADGGDLHGYVRSPEAGWTEYYRDLMNGNVLEEGARRGIPPAAWQRGLT